MASSPFVTDSQSTPRRSILSSLLQPRRSSTADSLPGDVSIGVDDQDEADVPQSLIGSVAAALTPSNFESQIFTAPSFGRHFVTQQQGQDQAGQVGSSV